LPVVEPGFAEIHVPHWGGIEQRHGFVHGGVVGMLLTRRPATPR
jgi:acyl-coenzyme A thioesterase PaaI-like protein